MSFYFGVVTLAYQTSNSMALSLWNKLGRNAIGRLLFSKAVCMKAPYFGSIKPSFHQLEPGLVEVHIKKRRAITNHLNTVHAIAMCNAAELAAGTCLDVSLDAKYRWIPVGMEVKYQKMAKTNLKAICSISHYQTLGVGDHTLPVSVLDTKGIEVFHAQIKMRVSARVSR